MAKIQMTKNYGLFSLSAVNRPVDLKAHAALKKSMQQYGFLPEFPIVCVRDENNNLIIWDGQHRYTLAQALGLPIHWIEATKEFDVATINNGQVKWIPKDYAESFAVRGMKDYAELLEFCDKYKIAIGRGAALLAGTTTFGNVAPAFCMGKYKITSRSLAESVATLFTMFTRVNGACRSSRLIESLMGVCRVKGFESARLQERINKCSDLIVQHGTREQYLQMVEDIYNFRMKTTVPLKFEALKAMRERSPFKAPNHKLIKTPGK